MKIRNSEPKPSRPLPMSKVIPKLKTSQAISRAPTMAKVVQPIKLNYLGFKIPKLNDPSKDTAGLKRQAAPRGGMWTTKIIHPDSSSVSLPPPPLLPPRSPVFQGIPTIPPEPEPVSPENVIFFSSLGMHTGQQENYNKKHYIQKRMDNDYQAQLKIEEDIKGLEHILGIRQQQNQTLCNVIKDKEKEVDWLKYQVREMAEKVGQWEIATRALWEENQVLKLKENEKIEKAIEYDELINVNQAIGKLNLQIHSEIAAKDEMIMEKLKELNEARDDQKQVAYEVEQLQREFEKQTSRLNWKIKGLEGDLSKEMEQKKMYERRNNHVESQLVVLKGTTKMMEGKMVKESEEAQRMREKYDLATTRCSHLLEQRFGIVRRLVSSETKVFHLRQAMCDKEGLRYLTKENISLTNQLNTSKVLHKRVEKKCAKAEGKSNALKRKIGEKEAEFEAKIEKESSRYQTLIPHVKTLVKAIHKRGKKETKAEKGRSYLFWVDDDVRSAAKYLKKECCHKKAKKMKLKVTSSSYLEEDEQCDEMVVEEPKVEIPWGEDENAELPDID